MRYFFNVKASKRKQLIYSLKPADRSAITYEKCQEALCVIFQANPTHKLSVGWMQAKWDCAVYSTEVEDIIAAEWVHLTEKLPKNDSTLFVHRSLTLAFLFHSYKIVYCSTRGRSWSFELNNDFFINSARIVGPLLLEGEWRITCKKIFLFSFPGAKVFTFGSPSRKFTFSALRLKEFHSVTSKMLEKSHFRLFHTHVL